MAFLGACSPITRFNYTKIEVARIQAINMATYKEIVTDTGNWQYNIQFTGQGWEEIPILRSSPYSLRQNPTNQGSLYRQQAQATMRQSDFQNIFSLVNYAEEDLLVRLTSSIGEAILMGTIEQRARLTFEQQVQDRDELTFSLTSAGRHPAYRYNPVVNV